MEDNSFNPRARMGRALRFGFVRQAQRGFNPRARMRRDSGREVRVDVAAVSIHAPAWGATRLAARPPSANCCFNPRARMGRDAKQTHS